MPNSLSSVLRAATGRASGVFLPVTEMPLASMVTCCPAMSTLVSTVDPVTVPLVPSDVAVAVVVTAPMVMKPARMEMPLTVALADAVDDVLGACEDDVPDRLPIPMRAELPARTLPGPDGAVGTAVAPEAPAVAASSPMEAVAVLPLVSELASMLTPGSSVAAVLGVSGNLLTASRGQTGAGGSGTPGTSRASSGPALATTWPG
jgi:hypothetical protein